MKKIIAVLLALILFNCSTPKKEESSSSDTTNVSQDTTTVKQEVAEVPQQAEETSSVSDDDGPPFDGESRNFPQLRMEPLSGDSLEAQVNEFFGKMMESYDTIQYSKITSSFKWERPYLARGQEGEGSMSTESEEETTIWYFDYKYQLKAFSVQFTAGPDFPLTKTTVYLILNDSLKAVSELEIDESEVTVTKQLRAMVSQCPRCGTSITEGASAEPTVSYLTPQEFVSKQKYLNADTEELFIILKHERKKAKVEESELVFTMNRTKEGNPDDKSKTITYPVEIRMPKALYDNYISKK